MGRLISYTLTLLRTHRMQERGDRSHLRSGTPSRPYDAFNNQPERLILSDDPRYATKSAKTTPWIVRSKTYNAPPSKVNPLGIGTSSTSWGKAACRLCIWATTHSKHIGLRSSSYTQSYYAKPTRSSASNEKQKPPLSSITRTSSNSWNPASILTTVTISPSNSLKAWISMR